MTCVPQESLPARLIFCGGARRLRALASQEEDVGIGLIVLPFVREG